jgi:hypothetical protein
MIQFNLLPDVKQQYIKAQGQKRLVLLISTVTAGAALTVFILLLLYVNVAQRKHSNALSKDIKASSAKLESVQDLDKILTVQNQLHSLPDLHAKKPVASRLFAYLGQVSPANASVAQLDVDFTTNTMVITGETSSLEIVNKFADTMKFTKYSTKSGNEDKNAFSKVVLDSFTRDADKTNFTLKLEFDPVIFSSADEVALNVPDLITTRSQVDRPSALFQKTTGVN